MNGPLLGFASLALALASSLVFLQRMRRVALSRGRSQHELAWAAALGLGIAAFVVGPGWIGGLAAAVGAAISAVMLLLRSRSAQARNAAAVAVGCHILDFTALDENGAPFTLSSLSGKPVLLKFFRGHW